MFSSIYRLKLIKNNSNMRITWGARFLVACLLCFTMCVAANAATPKPSKSTTTPTTTTPTANATNSNVTNGFSSLDFADRPWSLMFFYGFTVTQNIDHLLRGHFTRAGETFYNAELAYSLSRENPIRKFLQPVVGTIQIAGSLGQRQEHRGTPTINEAELYFMLRWINFPWNKYVTTSLAVGEGLSYVSRVPLVEVDDPTATGSRHLLNYLVFEATFAMPSHPELQFIARLHHRSAAYGVFGNTNGGSNTFGIGIRYYF
jgi:hypothetical protein